jgi:hypothetical protein
MRQRAARVICGAVAWIVLVAGAIFLFRSEKDIDATQAGLRAFEQQARETIDALAELRAAQQAYVVGGQGVAFWVAKVVTTGDAVRANIGTLQQAATAPIARAALENADKALRQFANADKRALEYINASQPLMAGDVIFTEGGQAAAGASQHVEAARLAERQDVDVKEASTRRQEILVIVAAALLLGVSVVLLVPSVSEARAIDEPRPVPIAQADVRPAYSWIDDRDAVEHSRRVALRPAPVSGHGGSRGGDPPIPLKPPVPRIAADSVDAAAGMRLNLGEAEPAEIGASARKSQKSDQIRLMLDTTDLEARPTAAAAPGFLKAAADLATDFGRVQDFSDLRRLIGRAATMTEASGVVVWLGNARGDDLQPVLTHGYSPQVVARLAPVPRSANNAAAAAYRSGTLQVVASQPFSSGAIVVPILGPEGCIGALSAEFRGAEASESVQAFAAIIAAHLAGVLAASSGEVDASHAAAS